MSGVSIGDNSDKFLAALRSNKAAALEAIGLMAERHAKEALTEQSAVDTGRLRGSVTYATSVAHSQPQYPATAEDAEPHGKPRDDEVYIGTNVEYAKYVEYGTRYMRARPYLKPAATGHGDEYRRVVIAQFGGGGG